MYSKILCPIDFSLRSKAALNVAIIYSRLFNSELIILNIHDEFLNKKEMVMSRVSIDLILEEYKTIAHQSKNKILDSVTQLNGDDIKKEIVLKEGNVKESIINYANTINPDIIIMGTNGKDSLRDYMIGTTASYVVENSTYPVLVMPGEK
jgi:nucleotide-binding universal stress UspA family protein